MAGNDLNVGIFHVNLSGFGVNNLRNSELCGLWGEVILDAISPHRVG